MKFFILSHFLIFAFAEKIHGPKGWNCTQVPPDVFICSKPSVSLFSLGPFPQLKKIGNQWTDEDFAREPIKEIKARADDAIDKLQVKYGKVWANEHGGNKGHFKRCEFDSKIIRVSLRISNRYGGFVHGIEFVPEHGPHCILGNMKTRRGQMINVEPQDSYLSHMSGGLDMFGSRSLCVNGIKFHWKKLK